MFRYAIATDRCDRDPAADLREALASIQARHHAAITDSKRVGELLRSCDIYIGPSDHPGRPGAGTADVSTPGRTAAR